jgi:hypothetical protein
MNAEIFAEWLRRQGHRVERTSSSYWFDQGPRTYQAFPYHWIIDPSRDELADFLRRSRAIGLRFSSPLAAEEGQISYHAVYENKPYGLESLGKWARKNVRRGLRGCVVEPLTWEQLATDGWALQADTLDRQGRELRLGPERWRQRCMAASDLPGFEAWGASVAGHLAASVITFTLDDYVYMLYQQCHRDYLANHVNNALSFVVTQTIMERPTTYGILYGLHSLDAPSSVDEFKFRMGYTAKPVRQRVVFHPHLRTLFNKTTYRLLHLASSKRPGSPGLAKTEGMMRFYLEGKKPLSQQSWPSPLLEVGQEVDQPEYA